MQAQDILNGFDTISPALPNHDYLIQSKPLNIKFGADPSAADLHLGHAVILTKLRQLQDLGHHIQFIIGDFTARIGDPTGKSETRKPISESQIQKNAQTYQDQVFKILNKSQTTVYFNSEWLAKLSSSDLIRLSACSTVARMLERDDFKKRFKNNQSISIHEFLYPLLQGYDSVVLNSDIELGGTDQTFNLLMGRQLQKEYGHKTQQHIMTLPLLEGLDGHQKMSKSLQNHICILDPPNDMYGKLLSIPDPLITRYFQLLTQTPQQEIKAMSDAMTSGKTNPKHLKERLACDIVSQYHSEDAANTAKEEFNRIFSQKDTPSDMPEITLPSPPPTLSALIYSEQIIASKKEIIRLFKQGAISINGEKIQDPNHLLSPSPQTLKIGKRRFYKLIPSS
ncbi:MAG: tyrosine--tRNA ligase [Actinobacteria bacterium]|nr:tyrosine--tRNA ligase [Actinomycetota bacterium]